VTLAPDSFSSRRDTAAFVICLVLALVARVLPAPVQNGLATAVSHSILAPFLYLQEQAEVVKSSRTHYLASAGLSDSTVLEALSAQGLAEENAQLRAELGLARRLPVRHVSAEVLQQAMPTAGLMARLSVGRDRGVHSGAPVITPDGLAGVVQSAGDRYSVAILWTHPDFRVSAMTADGAVFGIAAPRGSAGPNTPLLELRGVAYQQQLPIGTRIYTSGLGGPGGVYPRGIPLGTVVAVAEEREGWSRTYVLLPAVHPASMAHVIVLTGPVGDLSGVFPDSLTGS
jgi:rod shape-determining protein MreC